MVLSIPVIPAFVGYGIDILISSLTPGFHYMAGLGGFVFGIASSPFIFLTGLIMVLVFKPDQGIATTSVMITDTKFRKRGIVQGVLALAMIPVQAVIFVVFTFSQFIGPTYEDLLPLSILSWAVTAILLYLAFRNRARHIAVIKQRLPKN